MINDQTSKDPVAILFLVEPDENGYPSVSLEEIWCTSAGGDKFIIDNIPFYARDVSMGDEISTEIRDGERWFKKVAKLSRNTTVRVFARKSEIAPMLVPTLQSFGGMIEKMEGSPLIAVSLPASADIEGVMDYLDRESNAGSIGFEESSVRYR